MGCTNSIKKQETEVQECKSNGNGFTSLFHASTEFDLSTSESENEGEILSMNSINNKSTKKINGLSNELIITKNNSTTITNTLLDNQLRRTCI